MAPVLLPDEHHERHSVDPRRRDRADRVAEAGSRVEDRERGLTAAEREPRGHADDRALVEPEHEPQVTGEIGQQLDLGRARIGEERRETVPPEDVEGGVTHGRRHGRHPTGAPAVGERTSPQP